MIKSEDTWVEYFKNCKNILDVGCGKGLFIEFFQAREKDVLGIDISQEDVEICQQKKLNAVCVDAFEFLENDKRVFDGVYLGHMIEHLHPKEAERLIYLIYKVLQKDGIFMIATPDVKDIKTMMYGFWTDPTHVRPYPKILLERFMKQTGFEIVSSLEKKWDYKNRLLWKIRDGLRNALVGDYWGRDEVCVVGKKL